MKIKKAFLLGLFLLHKSDICVAAFYYGPMPDQAQTEERFVVLTSDDSSWHARSLLPKDSQAVKELILAYAQSQEQEKKDLVVYLYDHSSKENPMKEADEKLARNQARIKLDSQSETRPGPYQWLWFESKDHSGLIMLERMPRGAWKLPQQKRILDLYKKLNALSYNEQNEYMEYLGHYRRMKDQAILEIRILPLKLKTLKKEFLTDLLKTVASYIRHMSTSYIAPVGFFTEKEEDRPASIFSFTTPSDQKDAYLSAKYSEEKDPIFEEYFPRDATTQSRSVFYFMLADEGNEIKSDSKISSFLKDR